MVILIKVGSEVKK